MFEKVGVPILGVVENMAVYCCPNCGHTEHIFGQDGGKKMAAEQGMNYLGALPLTMSIRVQADGGKPTWRALWIRYAVGSASLLAAGLGFWWAWIDRDRLTWHDRASGTRMRREAKG